MWFASSHFVDMPEVIPPGFSRVGMCEPKNIIVQIPISTALVTDMKTMSMSRHFSDGQRMSLLTARFSDGEVRIRIRSADECTSLTEFGPGSTNQFRRGCRVRGNEDGAYRIEGIPEFLDDVLQTSFVQITYHCLPFVQRHGNGSKHIRSLMPMCPSVNRTCLKKYQLTLRQAYTAMAGGFIGTRKSPSMTLRSLDPQRRSFQLSP